MWHDGLEHIGATGCTYTTRGDSREDFKCRVYYVGIVHSYGAYNGDWYQASKINEGGSQEISEGHDVHCDLHSHTSGVPKGTDQGVSF